MADNFGTEFVGGDFGGLDYSLGGGQQGATGDSGSSTSASGSPIEEASELRTRDTIPDSFKGKLGDNILDLIDCGEIVYVPSLNIFIRRDKVSSPPAKPDTPCPGEDVDVIGVNDNGGVVVADEGAAASGAAGAEAQQAYGGEGQDTPTSSTGAGFCRSEERVSTHTCNSQFPATSIDSFGNVGIAWHDTRDGTHEIYFRTLASKLSKKEAAEILGSTGTGLARKVNLDCFQPDESQNVSSLTEYDSKERCSEELESSGTLVRSGNGRLDVNVGSRTITLSAMGGNVDFVNLGVQPGSKIRIDSGTNASLELLVLRVLSPNVLEANFVEIASSDTDFSFSILEDATFSLTSCETRLTCSRGTSVFPDVVVDSDGRFHVVYQSDKDGEYQLYYVQLAPENVGIKDKCLDTPAVNVTGAFGEVLSGAPGSFTFTDNSDPDNPVERSFMTTGESGDFFSYGNRLLVEARPNKSLTMDDRTSTHKLFRDFATGDGRWTGVSLSEDRITWNHQIGKLNQSISPEVVFGDDHPIAEDGDFGSRFTFKNLSFMIMTPPDSAVNVRLVSLPLTPRCAPRGTSGAATFREVDLVEAPKRPLPPGFVDPIDLSQIMESPDTRTDDLPSRFVLEDDPTGMIYTNIIQEDARSQLHRLVFKKDSDKDEIKFLLGRQRCGDNPCGVKVPDDEATVLAPDDRYKVKLQVWRGSDYRLDPDQVSSAQMSATLLLEKEFGFDQSSEISSFAFKDGEMVLPEGSIIFFVPIAGDNTEHMTQGVGGGNAVWTTSSDGIFDAYSSPYTVKPFSGLNVPAYYEGFLQADFDSSLVEAEVGDNVISTKTATEGVSVAFGNIAGDDGLSTADVVSQGFTIDEDRKLMSVIVRMAKGTAAGITDQGEILPADSSRNLVVEIYSDENGLPSELQSSVTVNGSDILSFDDSDDVPEDGDLGTIVATFNVGLPGGSYHVLLGEEGDEDKDGRFWAISSVDEVYDVGPGLWNPERTRDPSEWRVLPGQLQLMLVFEEKQEEVADG